MAMVMAELSVERRCPKHNLVISSPDGVFDTTCPRCEYESDMDAMIEADRARDPEGHDEALGAYLERELAEREAMAAYHLRFNTGS